MRRRLVIMLASLLGLVGVMLLISQIFSEAPERTLRAKFAEIREGMTKQEVRSIVGRPPDDEGLSSYENDGAPLVTYRTETWNEREDSLADGLYVSCEVRYDNSQRVAAVLVRSSMGRPEGWRSSSK